MQTLLKRWLDIAVAAVLLVALSPLLVMLGGLVWLEFGRPVFFRQRRVGRHGEPFDLIKFRTMNTARDEAGDLKPDAERLTFIGRWMRSSSLDELPQLWNILTGHMSLVGPRPLLPEYLPYYTEQEARRHSVRPGITGWAQVNGRNAVSWDERLQLDIDYVERFSLAHDLKILWRTALVVLRRQGINAAGDTTMARFDDHRREQLAKKEAS